MFSTSDESDSAATSPTESAVKSKKLNQNISQILTLLDTPSPKPLAGSAAGTPDPKLSDLLKGVVAYVDVRSSFENRSKAIARQLLLLGATVEAKFTKDSRVTHVIFKDGNKSTKDKAQKKGIHLVSVSWIDACKTTGLRASESDFPITVTEQSGQPLPLGRLKKFRCMQPKDFEEELANSNEKVERRRKMREKKEKKEKLFKNVATPVTPQLHRNFILAPETQQMSPMFYSPNITVPETPPSMRRKLEQLRKKKALKDGATIEPNVSGLAAESIQESPESDRDAPEKFSPIHKRLFDSSSASPACSTKSSSTIGVAPLDADELPDIHGSSFLRQEKESPVSTNKHKPVNERKKTPSKSPSKRRKSNPPAESTEALSIVPSKSTVPKSKSKRKLMAMDEMPLEKLLSPAASKNPTESKANDKQGRKRKCDQVSSSESDGDVQKKKKRSRSQNKSSANPSPDPKPKKSVRRLSDATSSVPTRTSRRRSCMPAINSPADVTRKPRENAPKSQDSAFSQNTPEVDIEINTPVISSPEKASKSKPQSSKSVHKSSRRSSLLVTSRLNSISETAAVSNGSNVTSALGNIEEEQPSIAGASYMSVAYSMLGGPDSSTLGKPSRRRSSMDFIQSKTISNKPRKKTVSMSSAVDTSSEDDEQNHEQKSKLNKIGKSKQSTSKHRSGSGSDSCSSSSRDVKKPEPGRSVVMTSLHFTEQDSVHAVVKQFGGFVVEDKVSPRTTHVICGNNRRTLNILLAIAQGCWLVSLEWVFKSLEAGRWLEEAPFELKDYFPAAPLSRRQHQSDPSGTKRGLFAAHGLIFVAENTAPPHEDLVRILRHCGAQITQCARKAKVSVGANAKSAGVRVSEKWILDSITSHQDLPYDEYRL